MSAAYPPGVVDWLEDNPGAHAGEVAGWWYCRYPVERCLSVSAGRCTGEQVLAVLKELRVAARLAVQEETGWRVADGPDGTWRAAERFGTGRVAAASLPRLRELIDGAEPTEAETGLRDMAAAAPS